MNEGSKEFPDERTTDNDPLVDAMLRWHLQDQLGPHVGGARDWFNRHIDQGNARVIESSRQGRPKVSPALSPWTKTMLGGAIAATIAIIAMRNVLLSIPHSTRTSTTAPQINNEGIKTVANETPLLQDSSWETIDQGVIQLDDGSAARRLLQRRLDTMRYFDRKRNATVEYRVPRENTVYVGLNKY